MSAISNDDRHTLVPSSSIDRKSTIQNEIKNSEDKSALEKNAIKESEAIELANDTNFGLAGAVWTADVGRAHRMANAVRAGTFWINSYKAIHVSSPFGGSLNSGFGRSSGTDALTEYTASKSVWLDSAPTPTIAFGYAPQE